MRMMSSLAAKSMGRRASQALDAQGRPILGIKTTATDRRAERFRKEALEEARDNADSLVLDLHAQWKGFESNGQWRFTPPTHCVIDPPSTARTLPRFICCTSWASMTRAWL